MDWYQTYLVETGRAATVWLLLGFVVAFAITRGITLRIRARAEQGAQEEGGAIKDVFIGGVHIHHQVWGILLVLVVGLLEFRFQPRSPWLEVLAALFGVGAALALDEFALWLHVEDVYWSDEGRRSIDAVLLAIIAGAVMLVATSPLGVNADSAEREGFAFVTFAVILHIGFVIACMLKGKNVMGLVGLAIPFVGFIGTLRLAKPSSFWAKRYYGEAKLARADERFPPGRFARRDRLRNLLAGQSSH